MPEMPLSAFSIGMTTAVAISSGLAPGSWRLTLTVAGSAFGNRSTPRSRKENTPRTTSDITSMVAMTGRRTQTSESMVLLIRRDSHALAVREIVNVGQRHELAARESRDDLHAIALAVAELQLPSRQLTVLHDKCPVHVIAVLNRGVPNRAYRLDERGFEAHAREGARFQQSPTVRRQRLEGERARLGIDGRTNARDRAGERTVWIGVDAKRHGLANLDPGRHALRNLSEDLQRIHAHDRHYRHLRFHQLADRDQPLLNGAVEGRADHAVAKLAFRELHRGLSDIDFRSQVSSVLHRRVVGRLLRSKRRLRIIERLLRDELLGMQCGGPVVGLLGLCQLRGRLPYVRSLLQTRKMSGIGGAISGKRADPRRLLLIQAVLKLLAIELDERLVRTNGIAEIGEHPADDAFSLRRNRDLILGSQRADDLDGPMHRLLAHGLD